MSVEISGNAGYAHIGHTYDENCLLLRVSALIPMKRYSPLHKSRIHREPVGFGHIDNISVDYIDQHKPPIWGFSIPDNIPWLQFIKLALELELRSISGTWLLSTCCEEALCFIDDATSERYTENQIEYNDQWRTWPGHAVMQHAQTSKHASMEASCKKSFIDHLSVFVPLFAFQIAHWKEAA